MKTEFLVVSGRDGPVYGAYAGHSDAEQAAQKLAGEAPGGSASVYRREVTFTSRVEVTDDRPRAAEKAA